MQSTSKTYNNFQTRETTGYEHFPALLSTLQYMSQEIVETSPVPANVSVIHAKNIVPDTFTPLSDSQEYIYVRDLHDKTHWSPTKTKFSLKTLGYNISTEVIERVWSDCATCGHLRRLAPKSKLNPRYYDALVPLSSCSIDHVDMNRVRSQCGKVHMITVVCDLTKYLFAQAVSNKQVKPVIAFLDVIQCITGKKIKKLYMDNAFMSEIMTEYAKTNGMEIDFRPSHSSRSVTVERHHRSIHEQLRKFTADKPRQWPAYLPLALSSLNNQVSDSHNFSPNYLFHGHKTCPVEGPILDTDSSHSFHLRLARSTLNCSRREKSATDYKYRKLDPLQAIIVKYEHGKAGKELNAEVIHDAGEEFSTISAKLEGRANPIKVHKSDIYIRKHDPKFFEIFTDLKNPNGQVDSRNLLE